MQVIRVKIDIFSIIMKMLRIHIIRTSTIIIKFRINLTILKIDTDIIMVK